MPSTFETNPKSLKKLLEDCESGEIQLPDFQRSWVWDEERIRQLLASISQAFPIGALMTLKTGGEVDFAPRFIQGAPAGDKPHKPTSLLLDGQQRMTSLYQTAFRDAVVETVTARQKSVKRWYYIDMVLALDPQTAREDAIVGVPEQRIVKTNFGKDVETDLSSRDLEYENLMFPVNRVFDWDEWKDGFGDYWIERGELSKRNFFKSFQDRVLENFRSYQVPVIQLGESTSKEAVCLVFEKVNTGGKQLDAFELVTASYAASNFRLRDDWSTREKRLHAQKPLAKVASTEFLQTIALLHSKERRNELVAEGRPHHELPAISASRQSLLNLPLAAYQKWADPVEQAYLMAAKLLYSLGIYRASDLPYQSQLTPLAAILADLGDKRWDHAEAKAKVIQWYWNGVFGELYGSAVESRFARDISEVPAWVDGGGTTPSTVSQATVRADRLRSMRSRVSAAYKGLSALLLRQGARDIRSGETYDVSRFFDDAVDIHHIFPKAWCEKQKIPPGEYDSIVNKTPLGGRTNKILGGVAPSVYVSRLEAGGKDGAAPIPPATLDSYLASHRIDGTLLRADDFQAFFKARQEALLTLIEAATGRDVYRDVDQDEPAEDVVEEEIVEIEPSLETAE